MQRVQALHTFNAPYDDDGNPEGRMLVCLISEPDWAALGEQPGGTQVLYVWAGGEELTGTIHRRLSDTPDAAGHFRLLVQP